MIFQNKAKHGTIWQDASGGAFCLGLSLIISIGMPVVGHAELRCEGSVEFQRECGVALERLYDDTAAGQAVVQRLRDSPGGHVHVIIQAGTDGNGSQAIDGRGEITPGVGSSTTVQWDPRDTSTYSDGVPRYPFGVLLHELAHSAKADDGTASNAKVPGTDVDADEIQASMIENEQRLHDNQAPRTTYCGYTTCTDVPPP
jgi:hypothetical protein